jgi:hypothetical protein
MSSTKFRDALAIGQKYEERIDRAFAETFRVEPVSLQMQKQGIDRILHCCDGGQIAVEYKTDLRAHQTGNAFVETISVDTKNIRGWAYTSQATVLLYYIPQRNEGYLIDFVDLRAALDGWKPKHRTVATRPELNANYRTHGILV